MPNAVVPSAVTPPAVAPIVPVVPVRPTKTAVAPTSTPASPAAVAPPGWFNASRIAGLEFSGARRLRGGLDVRYRRAYRQEALGDIGRRRRIRGLRGSCLGSA